MNTIDSGVSGSAPVYSTSSASSASAASEVGGSQPNSAAVSDSFSIGSFSSALGEGFDIENDLNDLYSRKAQVQGDLSGVRSQRDEVQNKISSRKEEIIENKKGDEQGLLILHFWI